MSTVNLIAPVYRFKDDDTIDSFDFADNIRLIKTPPFLKNNTLKNLSKSYMIKTGGINLSKFSIQILNINFFDNDLWYKNFVAYYDYFEIILFNIFLSTWILKKNLFLFDEFYIYNELNGNPEIVLSFKFHYSLRYKGNSNYDQMDNTVLEEVKYLFNTIENLNIESRLKLPITLSKTALQQDSTNLCFILFWMVLESLFGVADAELSFRLSQSISFFLTENTGESGIELYKKIYDSYGKRSRLVHGSDILNENVESLQDLAILEDWVQKSFYKILLDENLFNTFSSTDNKKEYLKNLPYNYQAKKELPISE